MKRSWMAVLGMVVACSHGKDATKPASGDAAKNGAAVYAQAQQERKDQNYLQAQTLFEAVRANFPYSQYAALSELALADMAFDRDDYGAAATAYQDFVKAHPSHPKADYAAFRVGLARYEDKAGDWFILPPSYERDQTPVRQALDAFNKFVLSYPKSEFVTRARDLINDCRQRLASHDRYVAGFYEKHEAWRGAANRWLTLADTYGDLEGGKVKGSSLWRAAEDYRKANDPGRERAALQRLVQESPTDPHRGEAQAMLSKLPAEEPKPANATVPNPEGSSTRTAPEAAPPPGVPPSTPPLQPEK
jgi:outer membrane protein assembly factor BamD